MTLELGVYSSGNTPRTDDRCGPTAQAIRDALEAARLADEVGLDFFGFGEPHPRSMHSLLGHTRQILQMDVGGMPQTTYLKAIELLGTEVLPHVRKELE